MKGIPCNLPNEWGPSQVELSAARKYELQEQVLIASDYNSEEEDDESKMEEEEEEDMENAELLDNIEIMALIDEFRTQL